MTSPPDDPGTESGDQESDPLSRFFEPDASDIPAAIEPVHPFTAVGEPITLYEGPMTLLCTSDKDSAFDDPTTKSVEVDGHLSFALLPHRDFVFQCTTEGDRIGSDLFLSFEHKFGILLPDQLSPIPITTTSMSLFPPLNMTAIVTEQLDSPTSDDVFEVQFYLVNFPVSRGNTTIRYDNSIAFSRINLQTDDGWVIDIDSRQNFNDIWKQTKIQRSFTFTHIGRIKRRDDESFDLTQVDNKLDSLFWFLSFLRGSPVDIGPYFVSSHTDEPILLFRHSTIAYSAKDRTSWYPELEAGDLNTLYCEFLSVLKSPLWKEIVPQLVSSYGSVSEGYAESRLSSACSALETMAWMRLVQENEWLTTDGFKKLNASDILRLLLQFCSINVNVPDSLEELAREARQMNFECPDIIHWVRNRVVHPDKKNQLTAQLKIEASYAATWYLELTLLHLFGYKGKYENRLTHETEVVPWSNEMTTDTAETDGNSHE